MTQPLPISPVLSAADRSPDAPPAVTARGLRKQFGRRHILEGVDLSLYAHEIAVLRGPNGAGKTTLLRCLAGLSRPQEGDVSWLGRSAWRDPSARRLIGLVAHESLLYPELTARENLLFAARMHQLPHPGPRVDDYLQAVGLEAAGRRPTKHLSRGMRQRVSIVRALLHDPPILLLDEPFSGLDDEGRHWLAGALQQLRQQHRAVCLTSHDLPQSQRLADRHYWLEGGHLRQLSTAPEPAAAAAGRRCA